MHFDKRVNTLTIGTAAVVAFVRHGISTKWGAWEGIGQFLTWWFIHVIAVYFLVFGAAFAISHWRKFFLGDERDLSTYQTEYQYSVVMTVLVSALAIGLFSIAGPFGSDDY